MENQETTKTLTELLELNFVKKIETFEELQKIYDYQSVGRGSVFIRNRDARAKYLKAAAGDVPGN